MDDLAIGFDIGNSAIKAGFVDRAIPRCVARMRCEPGTDPREAVGVLKSLALKHGIALPLTAGLSSCVPAVSATVGDALVAAGVASSIIDVRSDIPLPLRISYTTPSMLGSDRIADCVYAARLFPGENVVVVDAGSAVTVDCLSGEGVFLGGAILPGPRLQAVSLRSETAVLPHVDLARVAIEFPGSTTATCMAAGVYLGLAGAVGRLVCEVRNGVWSTFRVVACGGAWPAIAPWAEFEYTCAPDCTIVGAALCAG